MVLFLLCCGFAAVGLGQGQITHEPYKHLPLSGEHLVFARQDGRVVGEAWRTKEGAEAVRTLVAEPAERLKFERKLPTASSLGFSGYDWGHANGAWLGVESRYGMFLETEELNRTFDKAVERYISALQQEKRPGVELWLTTESSPARDGLRLETRIYKLEAVENGKTRTVFEVGLKVDFSGAKPNPIIDGLSEMEKKAEQYARDREEYRRAVEEDRQRERDATSRRERAEQTESSKSKADEVKKRERLRQPWETEHRDRPERPTDRRVRPRPE